MVTGAQDRFSFGRSEAGFRCSGSSVSATGAEDKIKLVVGPKDIDFMLNRLGLFS